MESAVVNRRPPARPVLDFVTKFGRYAKRTKAGFTQAEVAEALNLPDNIADDVLTSMLCGDVLAMRCGPHPTVPDGKYEWAYLPTARCWRMMRATAAQGGPTEQALREALSAVLVYGCRDPRANRW
jgi:hypothetical protein